MKKYLVLFSVVFILSSSVQAQIPNAGFEDWSFNAMFENPDGWSTTNLQMFFGQMPPNCAKSTDAVSNTYSLLLENATNGGGTIPGLATNGILGAGQILGGQPINYKPDSISGFMKYDIMTGDTGVLLVVTKHGGIMNSFIYIPILGTDSTWHSFSYDIAYSDTITPDSVIVAFTSGSFNASMPGSWIQYDAVRFTNDGPGGTNLFNSDWEMWSPVGFDDPDYWHSLNYISSPMGFDNCMQTPDAHSGSSAALLETVVLNLGGTDTLSFLLNGYLGDQGPAGGFPYDSMPTHFKGFYKYNPVANDLAVAAVVFSIYDALNDTTYILQIASGYLDPTNSYTQFDIPIDWTGIPFAPDTANIIFSSSDAFTDEFVPGSLLWIDDLEFTFEGPPVNSSPIAVDDVATTLEDTDVTVDVLDNDNDPDGDPLSTIITIGPQNGSAVVNGNETITYTPDANFFGEDSLQYNACDNNALPLCDDAMLRITVTEDTSDNGIEALELTAINVYPNPASEFITVSIGQQFSDDQIFIKILDLAGRIVFAEQKNNPQKKITVDVSKLEAGIYLVEISNGEMKWLEKLIKE